MAYPANHHFSPTPEMHADETWNGARNASLFRVDKRVNGLDVNTGHISGGNVVDVGNDGDQLDDAIAAAEADVLGGRYGYARAGFIRRALRGEGRPRFR